MCTTEHSSRVHCSKCHHNTTSQIFMSGFLIKSPPNNKTNILNRWRKRYFILRGDKTLEYYSSYKNKTPEAILKLEDVLRMDVGVKSDNYGNIFNIVQPKKTYYFSAGSAEIMWTWVREIKLMMPKIEITEYETKVNNGKTFNPGNEMLKYYVREPLQIDL